ncbi:LysE family transporter [Cognatishimia sp. MH4019]|uniref:LysE family transporter n=1 Tax=Cognatishimia sp. MH4019 TaxID=2854030 RepID=UPI001CD2E838
MTAAAFLSVVLIHLAAAMSPGPSFVVCVKTAASEGFKVASALAVGLGLGATIWAIAALAGLALLFEIAPVLLTVLKVGGGLFLCFIALMMWRHAAEPLAEVEADAPPRSMASAIRLGLMTQLANPKPAIFFGAVFIGLVPSGTPLPTLIALLALIFINETLWYIFVARAFSITQARAAYMRLKASIDRLFGGLIAFFGLKIALT